MPNSIPADKKEKAIVDIIDGLTSLAQENLTQERFDSDKSVFASRFDEWFDFSNKIPKALQKPLSSIHDKDDGYIMAIMLLTKMFYDEKYRSIFIQSRSLPLAPEKEIREWLSLNSKDLTDKLVEENEKENERNKTQIRWWEDDDISPQS